MDLWKTRKENSETWNVSDCWPRCPGLKVIAELSRRLPVAREEPGVGPLVLSRQRDRQLSNLLRRCFEQHFARPNVLTCFVDAVSDPGTSQRLTVGWGFLGFIVAHAACGADGTLGGMVIGTLMVGGLLALGIRLVG